MPIKISHNDTQNIKISYYLPIFIQHSERKQRLTNSNCNISQQEYTSHTKKKDALII